MRRIVIFHPNWLGDFVMGTPVYRALRKQYGTGAYLVGVMRPFLRDLLDGTGWLDDVIPFEPKGDRPWHAHWDLTRQLRRENFDTAILMPNSPRPALISRLAKIPLRIGYQRNGRGFLLTHRLTPPEKENRHDTPMVDYYLALAKAAGCRKTSQKLELTATESDQRAAAQVFRKLGIPDTSRPVLINTSGAFGASKVWPIEHSSRLARMIAEKLRRDVLILCGPAERASAKNIARTANHERVFSMADHPLDFGTTKAIMKRGALIVSTDSGPGHLASAMDVPIIWLYGPFLPSVGANPHSNAEALILDLDCIGCHQRNCPEGHHRCMRDLTPETVLETVARKLKTLEPKRAA